MRTVGTTILNAINANTTFKMLCRATVYNTRAFTRVAWAGISAPSTGMPQSFCWHSGQSMFYFVYNDGGVLRGRKQTDSSSTQIVTGCDSDMRPCLQYLNGGLYLYYVNSSGYLIRLTLNDSFGVTATATSSANISGAAAALHPRDFGTSSLDFIMVFNILNGAIRIGTAYWGGSDWSITYWDGRIAYPERRITDTSEIQYTATVPFLIGSQYHTFCYVSDYNPSDSQASGRILCVDRNETLNEWSDVYTAIPADLSDAYCLNGFSSGSLGYLAVNFKRKDDMIESPVNNFLLCKSTDGINWSMEENDLFTDLNYMFQGYADATYLYAGRNNIYYRANKPGTLTLTIPSDRIIDFQDSLAIGSGSASLEIANRDESFSSSSLIAVGNKIVVEVGYRTSVGNEYIVWGTYNIEQIGERYGDAERGLSLKLTHEGLYKISNFTHPVYTEVTSKMYAQENCEASGGFFAAAKGGVTQDWFELDFWDSEADSNYGVDVLVNDGVAPITFNGSHTKSVISDDVKNHLDLVEYPTVILDESTGNLKDLYVDIYAWSRSFDSGNNNDRLYPFVIVQRGTQEVRMATYSAIPSPDRPPRYYPSAATGNYPLTYTFAMSGNFQQGDKIKQVGVTINQSTTTETLIERVVVRNVATTFSDGYGNELWELVAASKKYTLSKAGRPYVMFLTYPARAEAFQAWGKFSISDISDGTEWGIVAFAMDARNHVRATIKRISGSLWAFIYQSIDGIDRQITSTGPVTLSGTHYIMFENTYGRVRMYTRQTTEDTWTQRLSTNLHFSGVTPAAVNPDFMHIGVYGCLRTPVARIAGYKYLEPGAETVNDGIAILPGYETALGTFASSGVVTIDESEYSYASKITPGALTGNKVWGPFQATQMKEWEEVTGIDITLFKYGETGSLDGYLLGSEVGYGWELDSSNWDIDDTAFRSRHFGASMDGNQVSQSSRNYVSGGFKGITGPVNSDSHSWGAWAMQKKADVINLYQFAVSAGEGQASIKDMADKICSSAGAVTSWADYTAATFSVIGGTNSYIRGVNSLATKGYEVHWDVPSPGGIAVDSWIAVVYNRGFVIGGVSGQAIGVRKSSGSVYYVCAFDSSYNIIEEISLGYNVESFRFVWYKNHCVIFEGGAWAHTFFFDSSGSGPDSLGFRGSTGYSATIRNVRLVELSPEREAVFFELSSTPQSALSSVFQERPIQIIPKANGSLLLSYYNDLNLAHAPTSYSIQTKILSHQTVERRSRGSASDIITYYSDVKVIANVLHRQGRGFRTMTYSLPNLDDQEVDFVATVLAKMAFEDETVYQISMRPDLRIEPGDIVSGSYTLSGTGTSITIPEICVSSVQMALGRKEMVISGRKKVEWVQS